jgi:RNA 3'-terminal phosphate cyclase (ATP)
MIIFLALSQGRSIVKTGPLTLHTKFVVYPSLLVVLNNILPLRTAIWVAEQLTHAKFKTEEHADGQVTITCDGIGFQAPPLNNPA